MLTVEQIADYGQIMNEVAAVRRFNRVITQRVGALEDEYLSRQRSLGLSRLLWEIGPEGTEVRSLRARLGLDSGYVSRQLRVLESQGLVQVSADSGSEDGRVRTARLTAAGVAERELLDRASDQLAESMLQPLTAGQRARLVAAMAEAEKLIIASLVRVEITDPRRPEARYCLRSYFDELGGRFNAGFDPSQSISASDDEMSLPEGLLLVATLQGDPVGCGALKLHSDTGIGEVKRMWVSQSVRGLGLGRRLLETLAGEASSRGMHTLRLETNETLSEARHLYETSGFVEVEAFNDEPYAHHWFQRDLTNAAG